MNTLRHTIYIAAITAILFVFSSCTTSKPIILVENPPFTMGDSYIQNWVAGVRGVGSGTNVHVSFADMEEDVVIKDIYFRGKILKAHTFPTFRDQYIGYGSRFVVKISKDSENNQDALAATNNSATERFPFQLGENEAVVSYVYKGRTRYYKIPELTLKPMTAYPTNDLQGIE
jgi:hypothetical protein